MTKCVTTRGLLRSPSVYFKYIYITFIEFWDAFLKKNYNKLTLFDSIRFQKLRQVNKFWNLPNLKCKT